MTSRRKLPELVQMSLVNHARPTRHEPEKLGDAIVALVRRNGSRRKAAA
jgi:hypothetical protein